VADQEAKGTVKGIGAPPAKGQASSAPAAKAGLLIARPLAETKTKPKPEDSGKIDLGIEVFVGTGSGAGRGSASARNSRLHGKPIPLWVWCAGGIGVLLVILVLVLVMAFGFGGSPKKKGGTKQGERPDTSWSTSNYPLVELASRDNYDSRF
jgi:hypothetical protein